MANRVGVFSKSTPELRGEDKVTSYCVCETDGDEIVKPTLEAATFPVNARYDQKTQFKRALKFCEYLNSIIDMTNDLEKETKL